MSPWARRNAVKPEGPPTRASQHRGSQCPFESRAKGESRVGLTSDGHACVDGDAVDADTTAHAVLDLVQRGLHGLESLGSSPLPVGCAGETEKARTTKERSS